MTGSQLEERIHDLIAGSDDEHPSTCEVLRALADALAPDAGRLATRLADPPDAPPPLPPKTAAEDRRRSRAARQELKRLKGAEERGDLVRRHDANNSLERGLIAFRAAISTGLRDARRLAVEGEWDKERQDAHTQDVLERAARTLEEIFPRGLTKGRDPRMRARR